MTLEEIKEVLLADGYVSNGTWTWSKYGMNCGNDCCSTEYKNVEEALDDIKSYCKLDDVEIV